MEVISLSSIPGLLKSRRLLDIAAVVRVDDDDDPRVLLCAAAAQLRRAAPPFVSLLYSALCCCLFCCLCAMLLYHNAVDSLCTGLDLKVCTFKFQVSYINSLIHSFQNSLQLSRFYTFNAALDLCYFGQLLILDINRLVFQQFSCNFIAEFFISVTNCHHKSI